MRVCAVICEYNPFHLGHAYHLRAAREASGADYVLCLMSGALTQRGAFARHDKWLRARAALENGAERGDFNALVRLPAGQTLPTFITELTGITDEQLDREGVDDRAAAEGFCRLLEGAERPLLVAYNAQFDLNFLYYLLKPLGLVSVLRKPRFLDALTVYRDRRDYPHKLCNAIEAYGLTEAENSHRAVDDANGYPALDYQALTDALRKQTEFAAYIDLFGTHPKYGMSGKKIASVTYCPQPYDRRAPLYELAHTM